MMEREQCSLQPSSPQVLFGYVVRTNWVAFACIVIVLAVALYVITVQRKSIATQRYWDGVCKRVIGARDDVKHELLSSVDGEAEQPTAEDARIARLSAAELRAAMREGTLSAERAVLAFARRARAIGNLMTNAVTQEFFDEAAEAAAAVDRDRAASSRGSSGQRILEGVPISIKDSLHMKGALSTCGMACKATVGPQEEDGALVKIMRAHGAIPFVRGNVPQCLMLPESDNAIFGRSDNPWNLGRTPGGSSGGEASLVASRCAPMAIGSDVGGSIRIPCHFTGTCGLKPTPERITKRGMATLGEDGKAGQRIIQVTAGPIANCVDDLVLAMEALCSSKAWESDAYIPPLPWDANTVQNGPGRPLKVGFFTTDEWFEPCSSVARAVEETVEGLRKAGHEVVRFEPPASGWEVARLYYGQMGAEGNMQRFVDSLKGEKMLPGYQSLRRLSRIPNFVRPFLCWALRHILGDYRKASLLGVTRNGGLSVRQYYKLVGDTFDLRVKWAAAVAKAGLDGVIYPTVPLPALPHGAAKNLTPAFTYTMLANLLHWPAGTVPVTIVRRDEEDYDVENLPVKQRDVTARLARQALRGSAGLPVGIQVMTMPFKDELALHAMREVERAVRFDAVPYTAGFATERASNSS